MHETANIRGIILMLHFKLFQGSAFVCECFDVINEFGEITLLYLMRYMELRVVAVRSR